MQIEFSPIKQINRQPQSRVVDNQQNIPVIDYKSRIEERKARQGRFAWEKKHRYKGCDPQWHELWVLLIPGFGCDCKKDFDDYCKSNPPDFSSPEAYFIWGFNLHNWVNAKLAKPLMDLAKAMELWNRNDHG